MHTLGRPSGPLRSLRVEDTGTTRDRTTWLLTLAARALSSGVAAFWLYIGIAYAITYRTQWTLETAGMAMLIFGTAASAVFAFSSAGLGGLLMLLCGASHGVTTYWTAESGKLPAAVVSGGPFVLAGLLFLSAWSRAREKAAPPRSPEVSQPPPDPTQGDVS